MNSLALKSALAVFIGGASYGIVAPATKLAFAHGFTWQQTTAGQSTFGVIIFGIVLLIQILRGAKFAGLDAKTLLQLLGTGATTCCTCIFYSISLSYLPVAAAITLLFQFTWIGIVIQMIVTHRPPNAAEIAAALIVMAGTVLASGLFSHEIAGMNPVGVACGLISAVSCALFMFFSGKVANDMPPVQRGLIICVGSAIVANLVCPSFLPSATMFSIAPYSLLQGFFSLFLPVILFGIGAANLPTGVSTILASAELPCSILLTYLILGEGADALQIAGVVVILLGVVVSQLPTLTPRLFSRRRRAHARG